MARKPRSTPESRRALGRLASAARYHGPGHPDTDAARAEWRGEAYLAAVRAAVAAAPPLSAEQRARLGAVLRPAIAAANSAEVAA